MNILANITTTETNRRTISRRPGRAPSMRMPITRAFAPLALIPASTKGQMVASANPGWWAAITGLRVMWLHTAFGR